MNTTISFGGLLEAFFVERLMRQRQASANTIASYRDTFCLLLRFALQHLKKEPSALTIDDIDAPFVGAFLDHVEKERCNSARSRNVRLAAIRSFFRYAALHEPNHAALIQRVLGIPRKRYARRPIDFLNRTEIDALLGAPNATTWSGRRDRALLLFAIQTGLRVSELIGLRCDDLVLGHGAHVRCLGKGRKQRCTPLKPETVTVLRSWLKERHGLPSEPLFPSARGGSLSRDGVAYRLAKHVAVARQRCPTLTRKRVSPHVLRHTTAMQLLQAGVDSTVIALLLGHETLSTVLTYIHADPQLKERALAKVAPLDVPARRFHPSNRLLAFLKSL